VEKRRGEDMQNMWSENGDARASDEGLRGAPKGSQKY